MANLIEEYNVKVNSEPVTKPCALTGVERNLMEIADAQGETEAVIDYLLEILVGAVSGPLDGSKDDLPRGKLNQLEQASEWRHEQARRIQRKICELRDRLLD